MSFSGLTNFDGVPGSLILPSEQRIVSSFASLPGLGVRIAKVPRMVVECPRCG